MKILHVIESLAPGGAERVVTDLVCNMPSGMASAICCLHHSGEMAKRLPQGTPIFELAAVRGSNLRLPGMISKIIKNNSIDIVHAHNWNTFIESIAGARLAGPVPIIHTIHGPYREYIPGLRSGIKKKMRKTVECFAAKYSCRICTVSDAVAEYTAKHLGSLAEVEVVTNGVDTELHYEPSKNIRAELGLRPDDIVFCFAGRLAAIKNLMYFFEAFSDLVDKPFGKKIRALIIGDGPQRKELEGAVQYHNLGKHITFLGFQSEISDYLHCADAFVLPSKYEGISVALLEAMAAGLPVVATDVGGNGQLVIPGENGYLVPLNALEQFSTILLELAIDAEKRQRMSVAARRMVCSKFSLARTVDHYLTIYSDCVSGGSFAT